MIRTVLIDDEREGLDVLEYDLHKIDMGIEVVGKFDDPQKALEYLSANTPDIVFLDIEMPWMSGFELLDRLDSVQFKLIFVTAYDQYAIKAFKYYAIDYLLKPVTREQLREAVTRSLSRPANIEYDFYKEMMANIQGARSTFKRFVVPTLEGYELINIADIVRCQADNNYVEFHLTDGKKIVMSRPLKYAQGILEEHGFFRAHHSHLINMQHVKRYVKADGGHVVMSDNSIVNLSRGKREVFFARLKDLQ